MHALPMRGNMAKAREKNPPIHWAKVPRLAAGSSPVIMLIEEALVARLTRAGGATNSIGAKIYPSYLPDDATLPAIVYKRKPGAKDDRLISGELDHVQATWEFHCYTTQENAFQAFTLANAVVADLDSYRGTVDEHLTVHYCYFDDQHDHYDGETKRQQVTVDIDVWYSPK